MSEFLIADTEYGKVKGIKKTSSLNTDYNAFYGIRYATTPVGELRFKDPLPPTKWEDVYDATEEKSGCYEFHQSYKKIIGSEDGLILNIFTKTLRPERSQPVLVYVHGGAFQHGSSSTQQYGPDFLLMADVVVVTINYRLGAFGFLSLEDKELNVPGNAGLKDQRLAMKFVKENIQNFGGDPENITLVGHSAGGSSVSWHCVSEGSKGLFHKAIIMSGCILNPWSMTPNKDWAFRLASKLGYGGNENEKEILKFLQQADPMKIIEFQSTLIKPDERIAFSFAPTIEHYPTEGAFILKTPMEMLKNAWSNDIDILIGGTSDEGLMYLEGLRANPAALENFKLQSVVPSETGSKPDDPQVIEFIENLKKIYYPTSNDTTKNEMAFCKIKTDQFFWHGMQRIVQGRMNSTGNGKTFLYRFAVDSPTQNHYRIRKLGPTVRGVCHADEISYVFKNIFGEVPEQNSFEYKSIQRFVSLITSFVSTGNPNDNVIKADMQNVQIDPVDSLEPPFKAFNIQETLSFEPLPESERLAIWDRLYKETNTPLF